MTQKSNFLGKQTKITVSLRIGLRGKISQQQQIKLLFAPKESTRACRSILYAAFPRSSNSRTPFVLHSKLSTLLSGLAGHSFSCSLYCILTHPRELSGGSQFRQIISIFLNGYIAICLVIDLLQCLSLRQLRSCNILFPTLSAIWMCQLDKCPANN